MCLRANEYGSGVADVVSEYRIAVRDARRDIRDARNQLALAVKRGARVDALLEYVGDIACLESELADVETYLQ